jgi:hypothetical protein
MGTRGGPGAALPFILTWSLYAGVPSLQGTDRGPSGGDGTEVRERPPSTLINIDDGSPGGARADLQFEGTQCLRIPPLGQCGEWL